MISRNAMIGVALATMLLAPAHAGAASHREQADQTIDLAGVRLLRVVNPRGEIDVRPGSGATLHLTATKIARSSSEARARDLAAETLVETERKGDTFEVRVRYPQHGAVRIGWRDVIRGQIEAPRAEVRLTLQIPAALAVELESASGDLSTLDLAGPVKIESASGDVTVISARGPVSITTASGDVEAREVRGIRVRTGSGSIRLEKTSGPVNARTTSGLISVRGASDSLFVRSVSGDIDIDAAPRGLTANNSSGSIDARGVARFADLSASSGDVYVTLERPLDRAEIGTVTGRISGRLAGQLACHLDLRTSSGDIEVLLPLELRSVSRRAVVGVVQGGKTPVVMQTSAGDIELTSGGE